MNRSPRPGPSRLVVTAFLGGITALFAGLVVMSGCSKPPPPPPEDSKGPGTSGDPWADAGKRLRKETDQAATKTVVGQLNGELAGRKDLQPPPLTPEAEQALAALVPLSPADREEVRSAGFTTIDATYLADAFYLRDAARSLDAPNLTPARRAEVAFAWVCRQVYLNPWLRQVSPQVFEATALAPTFVLRRGYGSGLERAYVFLGLLQQKGLDGCLIGPPDAADKPAGLVVNGPDGKPLTGSPRGPFWAVGVRVDNDILLFDPWRGRPFPGPDGKGVATLAQVKANPDLLKAWIDAKDPPWGVTADDLRKAGVFLTLPVSAISPRMAFFEEKVKADTGLNVAEDPIALRDRMQKAVPAGTPVAFWGAPADPFAYVRTLAEFLPVEDGGRDKAPPAARLHTQYHQALLPLEVVSLPVPVRSPGLVQRLRQQALGTYAAAFFNPPTPRERVQRGQFQEAAQFLTGRQHEFGKGLERLRTLNPQDVGDWCQKADDVYADLSRARRPVVGGPELPDTDPEVAAVLARVETFWKETATVAQAITDLASARAGLTESSYLLALCKHEEAEQLQLLADAGAPSPRVKAAWVEAKEVWRAYREQAAPLDPFPNRPAHARGLEDRAAEFAK